MYYYGASWSSHNQQGALKPWTTHYSHTVVLPLSKSEMNEFVLCFDCWHHQHHQHSYRKMFKWLADVSPNRTHFVVRVHVNIFHLQSIKWLPHHLCSSVSTDNKILHTVCLSRKIHASNPPNRETVDSASHQNPSAVLQFVFNSRFIQTWLLLRSSKQTPKYSQYSPLLFHIEMHG